MTALKALFRKKPVSEAKAPSTGAEAIPLGTPAYYEVWGSLESANRALWTALWVSTTMALLSLAMVRVLLCRPPVVIRVDGMGKAEALAASAQGQPVGEAEVRNFVALFEKFYTELNCYTHEADLKLASAMMTRSFQTKANDTLRREGTLENLKANELKTALTLTEIKIVRDTAEVLECRVKGYREISSYKYPDMKNEVVFEDDIVLSKVARSETAPYGLLVEAYTESLFKK